MEDSTRPLNLEADLLVIGWGKAGKTLARDLASHGRRVVLVERDDAMIGGTCINVACVPTKTLVNLAERRGDRNPDEYLKQAIASRDALIDKLRAANKAMLSGLETVTLVRGEARALGPVTPAKATTIKPLVAVEMATITSSFWLRIPCKRWQILLIWHSHWHSNTAIRR